MINRTLYLREMKKSVKLLILFAAVITMYVAIIITMYEPKMMKSLAYFNELMPQVMAAVGMDVTATDLLGFMVSYLYGFILLIFPMVYSIIRGIGLVSKYTDTGAMAVLLAAPVKRKQVIATQMTVLLTGVALLILYTTGLELVVAGSSFPGEFEVGALLRLNAALFFLHLFLAGIVFLASCIFNESRYSTALGAGIPVLMYIVQMLANMGNKMEKAKYFTCFTLFNAKGIAAGTGGAFAGAWGLLAGAVVLFTAACVIFCRKDMSL